MQRGLRIAAVTALAVLGFLAVGPAGTAAASPAAGSPEPTLQVYGTGGAGVKVHEGPAVRDQVTGVLLDGQTIYMACQVTGDSITDPLTRVTSNIWDHVTAYIVQGGSVQAIVNGYMSDLYATTPVAGDFSWGIRICNNGTPGPGPT